MMSVISTHIVEYLKGYGLDVYPCQDGQKCYLYDVRGVRWEASIAVVNTATEEDLLKQVMKIVFADTVL